MEIGLYYLDATGNQVMVGTTTVLNDNSLSSSGSSSYINHLPDYSLTIPAVTASDPWAGQSIGIALLQTSTTADEGGYWDIDNVRLTTLISAAWTGAGGNMNWSNSGNWTGGVPNSAGGTAVINPPTARRLPLRSTARKPLGTFVAGQHGRYGGSCDLSGTGSNTLDAE